MTLSIHDQALVIKDYFERRYNLLEAPASEEEIGRVEEQIKIRLPSLLREIYLFCNGFGGPLGACYLAPLRGEGCSLIEMTEEVRYLRPKDSPGFIFFGMDAAFHLIGVIESARGVLRFVSFDGEWPDFLDLGSDLFSLYLNDEKQCEQDIGEKLGKTETPS